jgi:trehalose 6-phosphate synthase/phosphatase
MPQEPRTIIVSNRLPVTARAVRRRIVLERSSGGLVTGLEGVHGGENSLWFGSLGGTAFKKGLGLSDDDTKQLHRQGLRVVDVPAGLYTSYYEGFSNGAIWPLFHYATERCSFETEQFEAYRRVNELFADALQSELRAGDRVWVQDYQLMLLPKMLRERRRGLSIGFFLHVPFPTAELFRILPWRRAILEGLLGADLVGFHTLEYTRHFSTAVARVLGLEPRLDSVQHGRRTVQFGAFPLGINVREMHDRARCPEAQAHLQILRASFEGTRVLLGVDRLDYTKGIPSRLEAFSAFLERHPRWIGRVALVQVSVPSRVNVGEYRKIKREVDGLVGRINGRFGSPGFAPIHYIFRNLELPYLLALYRRADVALVTPVRDGLNLVCKEYVAAKGSDPGVLVLSEFAGSATEMGGAILVNPWSQDSVVEGIGRALQLPDEEAAAMMSSLWDRLARYDNRVWSASFLSALDDATASNRAAGLSAVGEPDVEELARQLNAARRVFLFLDYDGTLVPVAHKPQAAVPTVRVMKLLRTMARVDRFEVALISGRDRKFLEDHLPHEVTIVAEHGASIRRPGEARECVHLVDPAAWMDVRPKVLAVMADFERRVPGSIIEEKEFGVVWHYRMADPIFASQQALVLVDALGELLQRTSIGVTIAKKAVEARHVGINKGEAVRAILEENGFESGKDLIITMGDDRTDEDMFKVRPKDNISIGVGGAPVLTTYHIQQPAVVDLLETLTERAQQAT